MNAKLETELEKRAWLEYFVNVPQDAPFTRKIVERLLRRGARNKAVNVIKGNSGTPESEPRPTVVSTYDQP